MYTRANSRSPQQQNSTRRTRIKLIGDLRQALVGLICSVVEIFSPTKLKCCWDYGQRQRVSFFDQAERNLKSIDKKKRRKNCCDETQQSPTNVIFPHLLFSRLSHAFEKIPKLLSSLLVVVVVSFPIILSPTLPLVILSHQTDSFWGGRNVWKENSVGVVLGSMWKKGKKKKEEKGSHTSDEALRLSRIHQLSCFQFRLTTPFLLLFCPLVGEREQIVRCQHRMALYYKFLWYDVRRRRRWKQEEGGEREIKLFTDFPRT